MKFNVLMFWRLEVGFTGFSVLYPASCCMVKLLVIIFLFIPVEVY